MLDLKSLEKKADEALKKETEDSLSEFINQNRNPEFILCAAIHYIDFPCPEERNTVKNVKGLVISGRRHHNIISQVYHLLGKTQHQMGKNVQGFLTSFDRFVDRYEALKIAKERGQIISGDQRGGQLYSEDLY